MQRVKLIGARQGDPSTVTSRTLLRGTISGRVAATDWVAGIADSAMFGLLAALLCHTADSTTTAASTTHAR